MVLIQMWRKERNPLLWWSNLRWEVWGSLQGNLKIDQHWGSAWEVWRGVDELDWDLRAMRVECDLVWKGTIHGIVVGVRSRRERWVHPEWRRIRWGCFMGMTRNHGDDRRSKRLIVAMGEVSVPENRWMDSIPWKWRPFGIETANHRGNEVQIFEDNRKARKHMAQEQRKESKSWRWWLFQMETEWFLEKAVTRNKSRRSFEKLSPFKLEEVMVKILAFYKQVVSWAKEDMIDISMLKRRWSTLMAIVQKEMFKGILLNYSFETFLASQ